MKLLMLLINCFLSQLFYGQERYAVVINEIMADQTPTAGLPEYEWIELYNSSNEPVSLHNWRLSDATSVSGAFPDLMLGSHQYVIICSGVARAAMETYGTVLVVTSFPSLDNTGEALFLRSADGRVIHAVRYSGNWHDNTLKKEGGWSLEMIDAGNPCSGNTNWRSSVNPVGGTPGSVNSIAGTNPDTETPIPLRTYSLTDHRLAVVFNEPLDSNQAVDPQHYEIDHGLRIIGISCPSPFFDEVMLETDQILDNHLIYTVRISGIMDCMKNEMTGSSSLKAGLSSAGNCVINEILFNPRPNGSDYVEIYNNGPGIADARQLYLGNRNSSGQTGIPVKLTSFPFAVFPGDHVVITEDPASLSMNYLVKDPGRVLELPTLPSYPDDEGTVLLLDAQGIILDEVRYTKDWHHKLISDPEGVALERMDPLASSDQSSNWHSAASTSGYGTPGYLNSQSRSVPAIDAQIEVHPKVFSPDNDGWNDHTSIVYKAGIQGFFANVFIFDAAGRLVRHLVRNELMGSSNGYWPWDGSNDMQQPLPLGIYIVQIELFNMEGKRQRFRRVVVIAKKLN